MIFLALDTSTDRSIVGLHAGPGRTLIASANSPRRHGRDLIPQIADLCRQSELRIGNIDIVAVGVGPGSYTGLRVGIMAAKTLAFATGAGLVGLDSLDVIAQNAPPNTKAASVIADAQRGLLYVADYSQVTPGQFACTRPTQIEPVHDWLARLRPGTAVLGPALQVPRIKAVLPPWIEQGLADSNYPDGIHLIKLAQRHWESGQRDDPWLLEPRYLRRSSAEELWEARPDRRPG